MAVVQYLNREIRLPASVSATFACANGPHDDWQMLDSERAALTAIVRSVRPQCAIEVGVYRAGSLGVIAAHSGRVYALDIDSACQATYGAQFPNVEFMTGPSAETLPQLLASLQARGEDVDFVLIDADHSEDGVRGDIDNLLQYRPATRPLYVLMHDSFNPGCRRGMKTARWESNPHVHAVELDFVMGNLAGPSTPPSFHRQMWCGLALAILLPEQRVGALRIEERERWTYEAAYRQSVYYQLRSRDAATQLIGQLRRRAGSWLREYAPSVYGALKAFRNGDARA